VPKVEEESGEPTGDEPEKRMPEGGGGRQPEKGNTQEPGTQAGGGQAGG
jgi:hypothetical protein